MAVDDFDMSGTEVLASVSRRLRQAGQGGLRRDLIAALKAEAMPLSRRALDALRADAPSGMRRHLARARPSVQVRTGGANPGVRVGAGKRGSGLRGLDEGRLRHPVFGNRDRFVEQPVPRSQGDWTSVVEAGARDAQRAVADVLVAFAAKLDR